LAWAMNTTISSRVYLNLTLAAHGRGRDGVTTGTLSSFHTGWANPPEGSEIEVGQDTTFGAKCTHRRIPLTTFTTVSVCLFSFPSLPCTVSPIITYHSTLSLDSSQRGIQ
jgi:hypothetical protein